MAAPGRYFWDATWNTTGGCSPVSPGCDHCYAASEAATRQTSRLARLHLGVTRWVSGRPIHNGKLNLLPPGDPGWLWPLRFNGAENPLLGPGQPSLIFIASMADIFHDRLPASHIDKTIGTVVASPHIGLLVTKRPARMARYLSGRPDSWKGRLWCGFSAENQEWFDKRWPQVRPLAEAGWMTFVCLAPMLGPITLPPDFLELATWSVVGGEQGKGHRPIDPDWARALRDQCVKAGMPFHLYQMAGRARIPEDLRVGQFPKATV